MTNKFVTLITTTGFRPEAFDLCQKMVLAQTYKGPIEWIIVDDTPDNLKILDTDLFLARNIIIRQIIPYLPWKPGVNTQRYNLNDAISYPAILGEYIFIWEDDDFYAPNYIEEYVKLLETHQIVGECATTYYNVGHRCWKEMENYLHASLCQTAFRKEVLDTFYLAVHSGEIYIDIVFWKLVQKERLNWNLFAGKNLCVGIKGMPGRPGIGVGHAPIGYVSDPYWGKLKSLVGEEYTEIYKKFLISK